MLDTDALVARCRSGDSYAIETLVGQYQRMVYRLALTILDDPADADEAAQESLVAAIDALETYRGNASFKTWLYAIVVNRCRDRLRSRAARERLKQTVRAVFRLKIEAYVQPEETALQNEAQAAVGKAVEALGDTHRLPIVLYYYHELTVSEIAQVLGTSERTVYNRLRDAYRRLHSLLKGKVDPWPL